VIAVRDVEQVFTECGSLILNANLKHQLYVKGFRIAELKDDGLWLGVNLNNLKLDRDRRSVVNVSASFFFFSLSFPCLISFFFPFFFLFPARRDGPESLGTLGAGSM
jgi:hypothetical protein